MDAVDPGVRDVLRACAMGQSAWPLLLVGGVGAGKTCAALALCDFTRSPVDMRTAGELADRLVASKCGRLTEWTFLRGESTRVTPEIFWREWKRCNLCVIDDIGQRSAVSDSRYEMLKTAVDTREGKPLILTSNVDLEVLADLHDDRIGSRLAAGTVLRLDGADRRLEPAAGGQQATTWARDARAAAAQQRRAAEIADRAIFDRETEEAKRYAMVYATLPKSAQATIRESAEAALPSWLRLLGLWDRPWESNLNLRGRMVQVMRRRGFTPQADDPVPAEEQPALAAAGG